MRHKTSRKSVIEEFLPLKYFGKKLTKADDIFIAETFFLMALLAEKNAVRPNSVLRKLGPKRLNRFFHFPEKNLINNVCFNFSACASHFALQHNNTRSKVFHTRKTRLTVLTRRTGV